VRKFCDSAESRKIAYTNNQKYHSAGCDFKFEMHKNAFATGFLLRTQLGSLQRSSRPLAQWLESNPPPGSLVTVTGLHPFVVR